MSAADLTRMRTAQQAWSQASAHRRRDVLVEAGRRLAARRDELDEGLRSDGLSRKLARFYGDWIVHQGTRDLLSRYTEDSIRIYSTGEGAEVSVRRPDGVVFVVTPANSPTINSAVLFSVLLPGNGVVMRAPRNDGGLRFVAEDIIGGTLVDFGFERELIQIHTGKSRPLLDIYLASDDVDSIVFFGNSVAGRSVSERGHARGKKVVLELDGSDHMIVWKDADLDAALESAEHAFDFSTQPCPIPKHLLVHEDIYDAFVAGLEARLPRISLTVEADPEEGNLVPVARPDGFHAAFEEVRPLGTVVSGGYQMNARGERDDEGPYVAPTLVSLEAETVASRKLLCFDEELFFPLIPVVRFRGPDPAALDAMVRLVNGSPFGLRCSVWSEDPQVLSQCARDLSSTGLLLFNDDHAQCPSFLSPWGGPRRSGGAHGESHFFWEKTSRLQGVGGRRLSPPQLNAVLEGLGRPDLVRSAPLALAPAVGSLVRWERRGSRVDVTLQRPSAHNALNRELIEQLGRVVTLLEEDEDLSLVVIRGAGPSFSSGGDLSEFTTFSPEGARSFMSVATHVFRRLGDLPVPVVAAVRGYCLGGGLELALHCDLVVAEGAARLGFPETRLGLVTTAGSVQRLRRAVGDAAAKRMLLLGHQVLGIEAHRLGLVATLCPDGGLDEAIDRWAQRVEKAPRQGIAAMKAILSAGSREEDAASWARELEAFERIFPAAQKRMEEKSA